MYVFEVCKNVSFSFFSILFYEFFIKYSHNYIISFHNIVLLVIVMFQQHKVFPWWFTANYWGILANSKCCLHDAMPDFYPFVFRNKEPSELVGSPPHSHILAGIEAKPSTSKDLTPLNIFRPSYGPTVTLKDRPTVIFQDDCGD